MFAILWVFKMAKRAQRAHKRSKVVVFGHINIIWHTPYKIHLTHGKELCTVSLEPASLLSVIILNALAEKSTPGYEEGFILRAYNLKNGELLYCSLSSNNIIGWPVKRPRKQVVDVDKMIDGPTRGSSAGCIARCWRQLRRVNVARNCDVPKSTR